MFTKCRQGDDECSWTRLAVTCLMPWGCLKFLVSNNGMAIIGSLWTVGGLGGGYILIGLL